MFFHRLSHFGKKKQKLSTELTSWPVRSTRAKLKRGHRSQQCAKRVAGAAVCHRMHNTLTVCILSKRMIITSQGYSKWKQMVWRTPDSRQSDDWKKVETEREKIVFVLEFFLFPSNRWGMGTIFSEDVGAKLFVLLDVNITKMIAFKKSEFWLIVILKCTNILI